MVQIAFTRLPDCAVGPAPLPQKPLLGLLPTTPCRLHHQKLQRRQSHHSASSTGRGSPAQRRHTVLGASRDGVVSEPWWQRNNPPNMKSINGVQEFLNEMAAAEDKLVIVDFYAKWCNACRALFPKLCQMAADSPDIVVMKVDFDENRDIVKPLAIKVLPYFHFYRGSEGRVAAFSASVSKIQRLRDALALHNTPRCSIGGVPAMEEFADLPPQSYGNNVVARHPTPQKEREAREPAAV